MFAGWKGRLAAVLGGVLLSSAAHAVLMAPGTMTPPLGVGVVAEPQWAERMVNDSRIDGPGAAAPRHAHRFAGAFVPHLDFLFTGNWMDSGDSSRLFFLFFFSDIDATSLASPALYDVTKPGIGPREISDPFAPLQSVPMPEPAAAALLGAALLGLGVLRRRRK